MTNTSLIWQKNHPESAVLFLYAAFVLRHFQAVQYTTALTTALPQIMEDFSLNAASGQWLTSIYSLVMGILVLCTAHLIKRFPTKNLYISSLLLFSIGVILNGFAQSFTVMMLGRIMQAAGIIVDHWGWRMIFIVWQFCVSLLLWLLFRHG